MTRSIQPVRSLGGAPRAPGSDAIWLLPLAGLALIAASGVVSPRLLVVGLFALLVVAVAARYPDRALLILIVLLPFQPLLFAKLYSWGVPAEIVRPLAGWKEALGLGVIVAGFLGYRASRKPLDWVDKVALGFVGAVALYALVPHLFAPNAPTRFDVLSLGLRQSAGFVLLFLGARHAPLPAGFLARAAQVAFIVATIVGAVAVYEYFFSSAWNDFVVNGVQYPNYQVQILNVYPLNAFDYRVYGQIAGEEIIRVGSVFLNPLDCAFYLLIGFAIGTERLVRRGARPATVIALLVVGAALTLTQTRSALIGALIIAFLALTAAPGRGSSRRIQFAFVLLVGLLLAIPAASSTGLAARASTTQSSDDPSAVDHLDGLRHGVDSVIRHPLGQGLGTSAGAGQRFNEAQVVAENNYIQVGNELGILPMLLFIGLTIGAIYLLRRAMRSGRDPTTAAIWAAAIGLAVGALFLHTWNQFAVSWTLWGLAGAAIGIAARERTNVA